MITLAHGWKVTDMDILGKIQAEYNGFTPAQRRIAEYIIQNYNQLAFMTLDEVANAIGVSTTSVIRFTRSIGLDGYTEFIQNIRQQVLHKESVPTRLKQGYSLAHGDSITQRHLNNAITNLNATMMLLEQSDVDTAAELIRNAQRVYVYGISSITGAAHHLTSALSMTHRNVHMLQGVGCTYAEDFMSLGSGDVLVTFLFPRYEIHMLRLLPILRARGVKIIIFSSSRHDNIRNLGDAFILAQVSGVSSRDSHIALMMSIEFLADKVSIITDYDQQVALAESMEELVSKFYSGL